MTWRTRIRIFAAVLVGLGVTATALWASLQPPSAPDVVWAWSPYPSATEHGYSGPGLEVVASPGGAAVPADYWMVVLAADLPDRQRTVPRRLGYGLLRFTLPTSLARTIAAVTGHSPRPTEAWYEQTRETALHGRRQWRRCELVQD